MYTVPLEEGLPYSPLSSRAMRPGWYMMDSVSESRALVWFAFSTSSCWKKTIPPETRAITRATVATGAERRSAQRPHMLWDAAWAPAVAAGVAVVWLACTVCPAGRAVIPGSVDDVPGAGG